VILNGESDAAIIFFFNSSQLATGMLQIAALKAAIGRRNLRNTFQNHSTKTNHPIYSFLVF